jgi:antirestriction protein
LIKKLTTWVSFFLTIALCLFASFFVTNKKIATKQTDVVHELSEKKDNHKRNEFIIDEFVKDHEKFLDEKNYDKLKLKIFDKILVFEKLETKVKTTLILSKCITINKKFLEIKKNIINDESSVQKINQFQEKLNNTIDKQVKSLYLEYGNKMHPVDKMFLEKIHE